MLDIYELNLFLIAAEFENFSKAANQLNLTQPAISMQIRNLEKKLDVSLFMRAGRSLALTEHGKSLIPLAREMVNRAKQIEEEIQSMKGDVVGHLKIGCSTSTGKYILPFLAAQFRQQHPRVQMSIYTHSRDIVLEKLTNSQIQLAVVSTEPISKYVGHRHFFTDYMALVVPVDHPWAERSLIEPHELCETNFLLRDSGSGTRQTLESFLSQMEIMIDDLNVVMELGNAEAISMAVEAGIGVAFIPRVVALRGIEFGRIKEVPLAGGILKREIFMVHSHRHPATKAQTEFWEFVQQSAETVLVNMLNGGE